MKVYPPLVCKSAPWYGAMFYHLQFFSQYMRAQQFVSTVWLCLALGLAPYTFAQDAATPTQRFEIKGDEGWRFLALPSESAVVSHLADDNLVQGIPGYYPVAATNLYVYYGGENEGDGAGFTPASGPSQALIPGLGFIWYIFDSCDNVSDPTCTAPPFTIDASA